MVEMLISKAGVPVNHMDRWSKTPLDEAVKFGHDRLAGFLRQHGAVSGAEQSALAHNKQPTPLAA